MTNYEKAKEKAFERIAKMKMLGRTYEEIMRYVMGMKMAFKVAEFLDHDELIDFEDECCEEINSQM